jgi:hypothetical protein
LPAEPLGGLESSLANGVECRGEEGFREEEGWDEKRAAQEAVNDGCVYCEVSATVKCGADGWLTVRELAWFIQVRDGERREESETTPKRSPYILLAGRREMFHGRVSAEGLPMSGTGRFDAEPSRGHLSGSEAEG